MTTIRVRDIIDVAGTDHAHARSESVPSAVDILRSAGTTAAATDATTVIDMSDAQAVLRQRESNGGRLSDESDAESDADSVLDMTHDALAEAAVNAGRSR